MADIQSEKRGNHFYYGKSGRIAQRNPKSITSFEMDNIGLENAVKFQGTL